MVVLKCKFGSDTRRIRVDSLNYEQLVNEILPKMFSEDIPKYHITYTDPENDTVYVTNDLELKEALTLTPDALVLNLIAKNQKPKEEEEAPPAENGRSPSPEKRKANSDGSRSPSPSKKLKTDNSKVPRPNYNYTPVRVMVIEALKNLTNGGTIHDIMDFVNENFPAEAKNIKDLHKAIQGRLSSRKEFMKAPFKKLDKLTKKECTVWTLSTQAGTKKVTRTHKGRRQDTRVKYDEEPSWDDEEDDEDEDDDEIIPEEEVTVTSKDINYSELVSEALRALGGKGTIQDIRGWLISHFPESLRINGNIHRVLIDNSRFTEDEVDNINGMKVYRLNDGRSSPRSPDPADLHEHKNLLLLSEASRELIMSDSNHPVLPGNSPMNEDSETAAPATLATVANNAA